MIYVYQIVTKPLTHKRLDDETCPVCNKKGTLELTLYMRYISALIPFYGMGRCTSVVCTECNHIVKPAGAPVFAKRNYPDSIRNAMKEIRAAHKRTTWQLLYPWSGLWLILALIVLGLVMKSVREYKTNRISEILAHPQAGDIYKSEWDENDNRQSSGVLVKVMRISGDTLVIVRGKETIGWMETLGKKNWDKLPTDDAAFDPREYKVQLASFLKDTHFEEFDGKRHVPYGVVLGLGRSNYEFEVVERK